MTTFIIVCIIVWILLVCAGDKNRKKGSLKEPPVVIQPINSSAESFDLVSYTEFILPLPATKDSWLSIQEDWNTLETYASQLDSHRYSAEKAVNKAIALFESDHSQLVSQQLQIHRRLYQSNKLLKRFRSLNHYKISSNEIPNVYRVQIPPKPSYPTPQDLQKKYSLQPSQVGSAVSRMINANGGIRNSQNALLALGAMAIYAAASVIKAKSNNSKLKRVLENAKGSISCYCLSLKTTVCVLEKAHTELVLVSNNLKKAEIDLIDMIGKVEKIPVRIRQLEDVTPDLKKEVMKLHLLMLEAKSYSKNPL